MGLIRNRLYGFSVPFLLLPLMRMQFDNVGDYIRNLEPQFRQIIAEVIVGRLSEIAQALLLAFTRLFTPA
jgi:hypothetical protein